MPKCLVVLSVILCVSTTFAADKKSRQHLNWSGEPAELLLWNGDLPDSGSSVSGYVENLTLSQGGGDPGGILTLPPGVPDNWNGGTGNWSNAGDWSGGEPGASSDVTIYSGGNDTVTLDVSTTISSLTLGGASNGTTSELTDGGVAQTLTITNALNVGATGLLFLTGDSAVTAGAASSNAGIIDVENASTLGITGDVANTGSILTDFGNFGGGNTITISGMLTNTNAVFALLGPGDTATIGSLTNNGTSFVDVENGGTLNISGNVTNNATGSGFGIFTSFNGTGDNTLNIGGTLTNSGNFEILGPGDTAEVANDLMNSVGGFIDLENGSLLTVDGNADNAWELYTSSMGGAGGNTIAVSGTLTNESTGQLILYGPADVAVLGGLSNAGFADVEGGSSLEVFGNVNNSGSLFSSFILGSGGNFIGILGNLTNSGGFALFGPLDLGEIVGNLTNSGMVDLENGSALFVGGNVDNSGQLFTSFELGFGGNTVDINGSLTNEVGATFQLGGPGDMATVVSGLSNAGTLNVFNGSTLTIAGGVTNNAMGTIDVEQASTLNITGDVTNSGTIATDFNNMGGGNTLTITGNLTNTGEFAIEGSGDKGSISGNVTNTGGGFFGVQFGTASVGGNLSNDTGGIVDVVGGGTLNITGDVTNGPSTGGFAGFFTGFFGAGGNTLTIGGTLNNSGVFALFGASDTATIGSLTNNDGALVDVDGGGSTLTITGDVTNSSSGTDQGIYTGLINGTSGNTINIGGMLTNSGIFALVGAGDQANVTGTTNNSGLIQLSGAGSKATLADLTNSGDIEAGNGSTLQINGDVTNSFIIETGAMVPGGGNMVNITGTLTNEGPDGFGLFGAGDTATIGGDLNNSAIVTVENGSSLTVDGNVTNSGTLATNLFGNGGGNTLTVMGTVTNSGTFELLGPGDAATIGSGMGTALTSSTGGLVDLENGSTLLVNGNADNAWEMFTSSMGGSGHNAILIDGTLTNESTGQFILHGPGDIAELLSLNNAGLVDLEGGPDSGMLVFGDVNNSGSVLTSFILGVGGNTLAIQGNLNNSGGVGLFGPGDLAEIGGNLTNATGAMIDLENGSTLLVGGDATNDGTIATNIGGLGGGNTITISGMLTNTANGLISLNGPGDVLQALAGLSNSGVINVNNGSSIVPPFFNNLGILNIDGSSRFVVGTPTPMGGQGYIQLANGTLGEMIASLMSFGVINVKGSALLDGTLAILLQGGYNPSVGSTFKFLNFTPGMLSGVFANIQNDIFNGGTEKWVVDYDNPDGFVELVAEPNTVPEPATLLVLIPGLLGMGYGLRRKLLP